MSWRLLVRNRTGVALPFALVGLVVAAPAHAQSCLGADLPVYGVAALGGAGFVSHDFDDDVTGAEYGLEGRVRLPRGVGGSAGVWRRSLDGDADPTVLRLEASWTVPSLPIPTYGAQLCPVIGISGALVRSGREGNDFTNRTVPIGLAVGVARTVRDELDVTPFAAFRILFSWLDGEVLSVPIDQSDTSMSLELGAGATYRRLIGSASFSFAGLDGAVGPSPYPNRLFTLKVGYLF